MTPSGRSYIPESLLVRLTFRSSTWESVREILSVKVDEVDFVLGQIHKRPYRKIEAWFVHPQSVMDRSDSAP
ncbi:MAG TPA: hypothetical protein VFI54_06395 [Solirubrobacteraceae bacterium]|nr:hypothetical protein [Solirubrobacteraceae bacterium]